MYHQATEKGILDEMDATVLSVLKIRCEFLLADYEEIETHSHTTFSLFSTDV